MYMYTHIGIHIYIYIYIYVYIYIYTYTCIHPLIFSRNLKTTLSANLHNNHADKYVKILACQNPYRKPSLIVISTRRISN